MPDNLNELEQNALRYVQIKYMLEEMAQNKDPLHILKYILESLRELTGGKTTLAIKKASGIWYYYTRNQRTNKWSWIPVSDEVRRIYEDVLMKGAITHPGDVQDEDIIIGFPPDVTTAILMPLGHDMSVVIDIRNISIPENISRYTQDIQDFLSPLVITIRQSLLLDESMKSQDDVAMLMKTLVHDIRNHVSSINLILDMISFRKTESDQIGDYVESGKEQIREIVKLSDTIQKVMVDSEEERVKPMLLTDSISKSITRIEKAYPDEDLEISIVDSQPQNPLVLADGLLLEVFANFFENSVKYTKNPQKKIIISWSIWASDDSRLQISLEDNGIGFTDEQKSLINNGIKVTSGKGWGIGLTIVRNILERYSGDFWVEDRHPDGSRINIVIPRHIKKV
ncbi:MAG: sensor histidine kinase [Candidatus Thorarchaeota archaeon]|jgi:signal transduction histidine kinase